LEGFLYDSNFATRLIDKSAILRDKDNSFIWFKYFNEVPDGYVLLRDLLREERILNIGLAKTATVTKHDFWGIVSGEDYWGESFVSVTSESNEDYKVVRPKFIAYNPSRANTGSLCINLLGRDLSVSPMYVTFSVKDPAFLPEYVFLCLRSKEGLQSIRDRSFGSVRQALRFDDLCTIAIPALPLQRQTDIVKRAKSLYKRFARLQAKLAAFDIAV